MSGIATDFLFSIALEVPVLALGETPYGGRRIARVGGGSFEGPKLRGVVLPGGGGWIIQRRDGVLDIEMRIVLETDDKQMICMHWKGLRHGPKDVIDRLNCGKAVDPSSYYFRSRHPSRQAQKAIRGSIAFARLPPGLVLRIPLGPKRQCWLSAYFFQNWG